MRRLLELALWNSCGTNLADRVKSLPPGAAIPLVQPWCRREEPFIECAALSREFVAEAVRDFRGRSTGDWSI